MEALLSPGPECPQYVLQRLDQVLLPFLRLNLLHSFPGQPNEILNLDPCQLRFDLRTFQLTSSMSFKKKPRAVSVVSADTQLAPEVLRALVENSSKPLVVAGQLSSWLEARSWTASDISQDLCAIPPTSFKVCPKRGTSLYKTFTGGGKRVLFETDCLHVDASFADFKEWLAQNSARKSSGETSDGEPRLEASDSAEGNDSERGSESGHADPATMNDPLREIIKPQCLVVTVGAGADMTGSHGVETKPDEAQNTELVEMSMPEPEEDSCIGTDKCEGGEDRVSIGAPANKKAKLSVPSELEDKEMVTKKCQDGAKLLGISVGKKCRSMEEPEDGLGEKLDYSEGDTTPINPLLCYHGDQYWVYADYKYMCNMCKDVPEILDAVDWGVFGYRGRGGRDSVLWVGSEGACTPCHYDTYGYNLVAQLSGQKRWTLFSPEDSNRMYPTRVPFEELSIFSEVDVECPNFEEYPRFLEATPYQVSPASVGQGN